MLLMMKRLRHRTTTTATQMDTRVVAASTVAPVANLREGAASSGMLLNFAIDCAHFHLASPGLFFSFLKRPRLLAGALLPQPPSGIPSCYTSSAYCKAS